MEIISGERTNKAIGDYITNDRYPYLIGRCASENNLCLEYIRNGSDVCKISPILIYYLKQNAGFYAGRNDIDNRNVKSWSPKHQQSLKFFIDKFIESQRNCDLLFKLKTSPYVPDGRKEIHIWSAVWLSVWLPLLEGKRILAISPLADTIKEQFPKRHELFKNPRIINGNKNSPIKYPEFELVTLKCPNTITGNKTPHDDWKETFIDTCQKIHELRDQFDLAILGCGCYGMPLASYVKEIGKGALYVGSYLQVLFGIKGKRWENCVLPTCYWNEHWVRPKPSERPLNYQKVENGCYW